VSGFFVGGVKMTDQPFFDFDADYSVVCDHFTGKERKRVFPFDYGGEAAHVQLTEVTVEGSAGGVSCYITLETPERKEGMRSALIVITQTERDKCHADFRLLPDGLHLKPLKGETYAERKAARVWAWGVGHSIAAQVWTGLIGQWLARQPRAGNGKHDRQGPTKRVRSTNASKIAYAHFLMETEHLAKTSAARAACTNTATMDKRENDSTVREWIQKFKDDPSEVMKIKKKIADERKSKQK
jgi:hypothetical protein